MRRWRFARLRQRSQICGRERRSCQGGHESGRLPIAAFDDDTMLMRQRSRRQRSHKAASQRGTNDGGQRSGRVEVGVGHVRAERAESARCWRCDHFNRRR